MSDVKRNWRQRLTAWVDGEAEPAPPGPFVMEQRPPRHTPPTPAERDRLERHRLAEFYRWYPIAVVVLCVAMVAVLLVTVLTMPPFGHAENPINNEVSAHYLEKGKEETGADNVVTAMIITYRGFDTLGESCVLFLAVASVMILLQRDEKNTEEKDLQRLERETKALLAHRDPILNQTAKILIPLIFLFAIYVLLNGEKSPGGGFSGGTILGAGLILYCAAYGPEQMRRVMNEKRYAAIRTFGLLLYALLYGANIFLGANGYPNYLWFMPMLIDLAVGLVVACTVYGFYMLFSRGEI